MEELKKLNATWKLDNYVEQIVLDEYREEDPERYKLLIQSLIDYCDDKRTVYSLIKKKVNDENLDEGFEWSGRYYEGPKNGNKFARDRMMKRMKELEKK